jgi:hypothetical protein
MNRFVFAVVILLLIVGAVGYFQGWFTVSEQGDDHRTRIGVTVDKDKINEDEEKAKNKAAELEKKLKEKAGEVKDNFQKDTGKR